MMPPGMLPSLSSSRKQVVGIGFFLVVIFLAYKAAEAILADDLTSMIYAAFLAGGVVVVVAILNDWRRGVYIFFAWIFLEDFVRKFLGNNMAIYFGKDALVVLLYLSFLRAQFTARPEKFRIPFRIPLLVFFWFGLLQVFNPNSASILYGILGMKVYFLYVPLIYVGFAFSESDEDLRRFLSFTAALILIVAALGVAQSVIGPSFLNPSHMQEDIRELSMTYRTAPISGQVAYRPTSVFVSAGRFMDFLIVAWVISLGTGGYLLLRSRQGRTLSFITLGVVAAASLMSASRGVFMWNSAVLLIVAAGFLWGAPWRQREVMRVVRAIQRTTLFVGIGIILLLTVFPKELGSRLAIYSETLMPNSSASELVNRTKTYPLQELSKAFDHVDWPYGYGIGTCTLGTQYVARILHAAPMFLGVESGYGNLIIELGIVGLLLWLALGASISLSAWQVAKELRGTPWFPLAFVIFLFSFLIFFPITLRQLQFLSRLHHQCLSLDPSWHTLPPTSVLQSGPTISESSGRKERLICASRLSRPSWIASMVRSYASSSRLSALPSAITGTLSCIRRKSRKLTESRPHTEIRITQQVRSHGIKFPVFPDRICSSTCGGSLPISCNDGETAVNGTSVQISSILLESIVWMPTSLWFTSSFRNSTAR